MKILINLLFKNQLVLKSLKENKVWFISYNNYKNLKNQKLKGILLYKVFKNLKN